VTIVPLFRGADAPPLRAARLASGGAIRRRRPLRRRRAGWVGCWVARWIDDWQAVALVFGAAALAGTSVGGVLAVIRWHLAGSP
jgi:hypothetical protein